MLIKNRIDLGLYRNAFDFGVGDCTRHSFQYIIQSSMAGLNLKHNWQLRTFSILASYCDIIINMYINYINDALKLTVSWCFFVYLVSSFVVCFH